MRPNLPESPDIEHLHGRPLARRRHLLCCGAAAMLGGLGLGLPKPTRAAPWATACRPGLPGPLRSLAEQALQGLDAQQLCDVHVHLLGNGDSGSGCTLHPSLTQGLNLVERARHRVILDAACVPPDAPSVDRAYVERLLSLAQGFPAGARWMLFAFEQAHGDDGLPDLASTTMHVPDAYAQAIAQRWPQHFGWVASIHPYRRDTLSRLEAAARAGAQAVKWLPGAMAIDLRDARCRPFYDRLAALDLPLIVHCGEERAVPGAQRHELGNPLHVREPLARGTRVIVAHCASLGHARDSDRAGAPEVPAFELFGRLMDETACDGRLLGDISAVFQHNRKPAVWTTLLTREDWHSRLLHGSDHPLPGLSALTRLGTLARAGLLDDTRAGQIAELREHNPLLADLVLKRCLHHRGRRLSDSIFQTRRHLEPRA